MFYFDLFTSFVIFYDSFDWTKSNIPEERITYLIRTFVDTSASIKHIIKNGPIDSNIAKMSVQSYLFVISKLLCVKLHSNILMITTKP